MTSFEMQEGLITYDTNGSINLLPGYMFDPTNEVLVDFYLKRRIFAQPLPVQIIPDFDVFQIEPWGLPGDGKIFNERKCFFYNTMGRDLGCLNMRTAGIGHWKVVEIAKDVPIPQSNEVIGKRNTLVFWEVQGACYRKTKWVMHEFRLVSTLNPSKMANWVVYRIFQKNDSKNVKKVEESNVESFNYDRIDGSVEVIDFKKENKNFSCLTSMTPSFK
ncbi:NAC domain-containing protein 83-like [Lotus japonicus]|uniref:NAC domain-containing protein 83-like n=1 Tax=Lotus japonicus TaxID=34305 RepID=UPI00258D64AE|nr:NAC domain-containing protein 83-like [Lotus japonicus]